MALLVSIIVIIIQGSCSVRLARVMRQTISNTSQTISDLANVLRDLKYAFTSGAVLQTAFVSAQTLEQVEKLGMWPNIEPVALILNP
jgi:hypothetical protein